jgi:hypothetical protein
MLDYKYVVIPHIFNNMYYNAFIDGLNVSVDYTNKKIVVAPGKAVVDGKEASYDGLEYTFTQGHKWAVVWIDPSDMSLKVTEGPEEPPSCIDPAVKYTCFRPRPPLVQGVTLAVVPLWP